MWFIPETEGNYDLYCAEYCGLRHSYMKAMVKVLPKDKFTSWYGDTASLAKTTKDQFQALRMAIMKIQGCLGLPFLSAPNCRPTYLNLFGSQQVVIRMV